MILNFDGWAMFIVFQKKMQTMNNQIAEKILDTIGALGAIIFCPIWVPIVALMAVSKLILFAWYYYFGNN